MSETSTIDELLEKGKNYTSKTFELNAKHLLWLLMEFGIHRYLQSNTYGKADGSQKAHWHFELCKIAIASIYQCDIEDAAEDDERLAHLKRIHGESQELTCNLDKEIGFPLKEKSPNYEKLAPLFFDKFIEIALNTE